MEVEVEVEVRYNGRLKKKINRPLRKENGKRCVVYKGKFYEVHKGDYIEIGTSEAVVGEEASPLQLISKPSEPVAHASKQDVPESLQMEQPEWDSPQKSIIEAGPDERRLVSACPGAGKTAITCARVAHLIDKCGLEPSTIIVISFSRTAILEIRKRIGFYLKEPSFMEGIKIATLDSYAWQVHSGLAHSELKITSYEENIEGLIRQIETDDLTRDTLAALRHVFVDEAQDILSTRATLVEKVLECLNSECGVTALGDPAQAIYGFGLDEDAAPEDGENLMSRLTKRPDLEFRACQLDKVYRTDSPKLNALYSDVRRRVLAIGEDDVNAPAMVAAEISKAASGVAINAWHASAADFGEGDLLLYRRRSEVLLASALLNGKGIQHRLRMSGQPVCLYPWIAAALGVDAAPVITRGKFVEAWAARCAMPHISCGFDADSAWELLSVYESKRGQIRRGHLLEAFSRARPPVQFTMLDYGLSGPVLGTIHASKGREAARVHLMLPKYEGAKIEAPGEEARVAFVGATRAQKELRVASVSPSYAKTLGNRVFRNATSPKNGPAAQIQFGCEGDISAESVAGKAFYDSPEECLALQKQLLDQDVYPFHLTAVPVAGRGDAYRLVDGDVGWGWLDPAALNHQLRKIGKAIKKGNELIPPSKINYISVVGVRTIACKPDSPEGRRLHDTLAPAGFFLAPMVTAYSMGYFQWMKKKH